MRISVIGQWGVTLVFSAAFMSVGNGSIAAETSALEKQLITIDRPTINLAPYVWKQSGTGIESRAEAAMPGAYLKVIVAGTTTIGLSIDGVANHGCPAPSMPVIEFSIDEGTFKAVALTRSDGVYVLPLAEGLDAKVPHRVELYFRASDLTQSRWESPKSHLRISGIVVDMGGALLKAPSRPLKAIGFGDSITEGVGVDGLFTSWQLLGVNNARSTWFPFVCAAMGCEYGQLGTGGQGISRGINVPSLRETWDRYDPSSSRLTQGLLLPEPDYVFCCHGTNDFDRNITADYTGWLADMRKACPNARLFCVIPPLGLHRTEIVATFEARRNSGDRRVHLIETEPLKGDYRIGKGATKVAFDGVHPSQYGNALLGALIAVEAQKVLDPARP